MRKKVVHNISSFLTFLLFTNILLVSGAQVFGEFCAMPSEMMSESCCSSAKSSESMNCCEIPLNDSEASFSCLCSLEVDSFTFSQSHFSKVDLIFPFYQILAESLLLDRVKPRSSTFFDSQPHHIYSALSLSSLQRFLI